MTSPWPAPAKLNLFLHIVGRRDDGLHRLQSVFEFIDLQDQIHIDINDRGLITRSGDLLHVDQQVDLTLRAARLLQSHTGCRQGAHIHVDKQLPEGGGVGGGSSDAATVLHALNQLWCLNLDRDALADLGLQLGADVPVFVRGRTAWAEGVGELLTPVQTPDCWYALIAPGIHVSTPAVFQDPQLTRNTPIRTIRAFSATLESAGCASGFGHNDCELVVRRLHPEIDAAMNHLDQFGEARLTGTGACVFASFVQRSDAQAAIDALPHSEWPDWTGFVAKGLNRSPLLDRLSQD